MTCIEKCRSQKTCETPHTKQEIFNQHKYKVVEGLGTI